MVDDFEDAVLEIGALSKQGDPKRSAQGVYFEGRQLLPRRKVLPLLQSER